MILPTASGAGWDSDRLDLDAYLARIGHAGRPGPSAGTLRALHHAHVLAIPFDNLEIWLGRPIPLDLPSLQDKLVKRGRGGYCYEHTLLFAAVLDRLGFRVTGLGARVRVGSDQIRPTTHALLSVDVDGQRWLADVGFGGTGLLEPILLRDAVQVVQHGWTYRLTEEVGGVFALRALRPEGWLDLHAFTLERRYRADFAVMNHYISTHPRSPFVGRLVVGRTDGARRLSLNDTRLTVARPDTTEHTTELRSEDLPTVLRDVFGYHLEPDEAARLSAAA